MTYQEGVFTHGGPGLFKKSLEAFLAEGWTLTESIESAGREGIGAATLLVSTTASFLPAISVVLTNLNQAYDLPVAMLTNQVVKKGVTTLVVGTDYTIDKARGRITGLSGGPGALVAGDTVTIAAGAYEIRQGWLVLSSTGVSGLEDFKIGMRMLATACSTSGVFSGSATSPTLTGVQWCCFKTWTTGGAGSVWITDSTRTVRNALTRDVLMAVNPTDQLNNEFFISVTKNNGRVSSINNSSSHRPWVAIGGMRRIRPIEEQGFITAMMGNDSSQAGAEANGPVGDQDNPGSTTATNIGSAYLYDVGRFAHDGTGSDFAVDLNGNHLQAEVNGASWAVPTNAGYFELIPAVVSRNSSSALNADNRIYGVWDGIMQVVKSGIGQKQLVTWQGEDYILLGQGGSSTRFIALRKT